MGLVRIWKATSKLARDTYYLERAEVGIGKNMESKLARDTHQLGREEVGISKNMESKQRTLTF